MIILGQAGDDTNGWKAKGWNLEKPDWTGKLKLISRYRNVVGSFS